MKPKRLSPEHDLQVQCVTYLRYQYPTLRPLFYAVPNGGDRNEVVAARLKAEGVTPGVSDLILQLPAQGYHQLCIELKAPRGTQSPEQKVFQACAEIAGALYVVVRNYDEFKATVDDYISHISPAILDALAVKQKNITREKVDRAWEKLKARTTKPEAINKL